MSLIPFSLFILDNFSQLVGSEYFSADILNNIGDECGEEVEDGGRHLVRYVSSLKSFQRREECRTVSDWYTLDDGVDQGGGQCDAVEDGEIVEVSNTFNSGF